MLMERYIIGSVFYSVSQKLQQEQMAQMFQQET